MAVFYTRAALAAAALALVGCALPQDGASLPLAQRQAADSVPGQWAQGPAMPATPVSQQWWRGFGSPELEGLVAQVQAQSWDVAAAAARVQQAQASARQSGAALLPTVSATADAQRQRTIGSGSEEEGARLGVGLSARYEVDFWGGNRAALHAAQARLQASQYDRATVVLTATAGAASTWMRGLALRERLSIAESNLATAQRLLRWIEARARSGAATALELAQQRGLVAAQQRTVAALQQQVAGAQVALAVLLGQPAPATQAPAQVAAAHWAALQLPRVETGLPAQLLARRPDIARAEAQLAAADADVSVARAALLPQLSLTASLGTESRRWRDVLESPLATLAANLALPLFNGGRLEAGRDLAQARRDELLAAYRQSIVGALGDVEVALHAVDRLQAQAEELAEELAQARRALALAERRHQAGAETLLPLLDAQRTLYAALDAEVQLRLARLQASVDLYKALGGGWEQGDTLASQ